MKIKRVLVMATFMIMLFGFSGSQATAEAPNISEECKAEIRAVLETCHQTCGRDLRCFIRCIVNNIPPCLQQ